MHQDFKRHVESVHPAFEMLMQSVPFAFGSMPNDLPMAGIYVFSENDRHLYVGRTNNLRARLQQHCRPSSSHNSAAFAFRLAREACGVQKATYKTEGSRAQLTQTPAFAEAFTAAKARMRAMSVRVVEESEPVRQALLEMYVAMALDTLHNGFDNH
jgi:hypothetical protein